MEKLLVIFTIIILLFTGCREKEDMGPREFRIFETDTVFPGKNYVLNAEISGVSAWYWDDPNVSYGMQKSLVSKHFYTDTGTYHVRLFHGSDSTSLKIHVVPLPLIFIPNSFTPNGDSLNDEFYPTLHYVMKYEFKILDKRGVELFNSEKMLKRTWDGTVNDTTNKAEPGTYNLILEFTDLMGVSHSLRSLVNLIL